MSGGKPNKKGGGGNGKGKGKDTFIATTAGFVVFTGIAVSLFKAFKSKKLAEEVSPPQPSQPSHEAVGDVPDQLQTEPTVKEKTNDVVKEVNIFGFHKGGNKKKSSQTIEIIKGDSLWSLSRKYGVSVDQIKTANKYTDDIIYAGEKLIIP